MDSNRSGYTHTRPSNSQASPSGKKVDHREAMKEMMKKMMDPSK
jgi:hypothetical protein